LGFQFSKQEQKENANKAKYFWIFQTANRKWQVKQNKGSKLKRQTKRNNGNIFGLFVFWNSGNKNKNNKENETWIYI
jgi:hypothetical protein